jgi:selenocysteine-specific elongation factor
VKSIVVGTAGHIDHGKSALVRALTGTDPDRLKEEKARGITIDLGFAHLETGGAALAFVDVPGHERFVKNMLAGAAGIDAVMLIVAADESVMPQTREHFQICRLLQVPAGVIVLTKSDIADADMREVARMEARELVSGSFLEDAPIVEVSSKTGEGLDELRSVLAALAARVPGRPAGGPVRLPIDRVFSVKGFGTVVTGTLVSGALDVDEELEVMPRDFRVKVRGLQVHGRSEASASAGRRVAVNLGGVDVADLARGDTLCGPGAFEPTRRFDVVVDLLADARPLKHGARVRFHHGTTELLGRVAVAGGRTPEAGVNEVPAGASAFVRIRLEAPAVLTRGDRFILRAYSPSITIGGGAVLDPHPPRGAIRTASGVARFRRLDFTGQADAASSVAAFVEERQGAGLPREALVSRAGLTPDAAAAALDRLVRAGTVTLIGDLLVSTAVLRTLSERLVAAIKAHHAAQPLSDGVPREEARERIFGRSAVPVFEHVLGSLVAERTIVARDRLALAGHQLTLSPEEADAQAALERVFRAAGLAPPDLAAAAIAAGVSPALADRVSKLLLRQKTLVKVDVLWFHADALSGLKADVRALKGTATARVDVSAFKERYGISRKYAIPLLEYLDRERVTRRVGDSRVVL